MFPDYFQYIKGSDITFKGVINVVLARKILTLCLHACEMGNILSFTQKKQGKYEQKENMLKIILYEMLCHEKCCISDATD